MNIHGIKKHIQEIKQKLKKSDNYKLEKRLKILRNVLKSKLRKKAEKKQKR